MVCFGIPDRLNNGARDEAESISKWGKSPAQFSVVPFNQVLDMLMKDTIEEANRLEQEEEKIFALSKESVKESQLG